MYDTAPAPGETRVPQALGANGMIATGQPLATVAGLQVLRDGGNAFDAAVCIAATLAVVRPQMCGLGGDVFMLVYPRDLGRVEALNGNGAAPRLADADLLRPDGIPLTGPLPVVVPGTVDGWLSIHERYGSLPLERLFAPAIGYARNGFPMYPKLADDVQDRLSLLASVPALSEIFLRGGAPLPVGALVRQPALARTLETIAEGGQEPFYRGAIAEQIARHFEKVGGWLRADDLAAHTSRWSDPLETTYRGLMVYEQPPASQGFMLLTELNIVEQEPLADLGHLSAESIHLMVEAKKLAFSDRDRYLGDTEFVDVPMARLLSKAHARELHARIDPFRAAPVDGAKPDAPDTTYFAVVDREGNGVSGIQSLSHAFGGGAFVAEAGIIMNNRLAGFNLEHEHPNVLQGGKRPVHTLNTYMVFDSAGPLLVGGSPGGDGQVQTNLQVITGIVDFGLSPQEAVEVPRWISGEPRWLSTADVLRIEPRLAPETLRGLEQRGHHVKPMRPWDPTAGSAKVIRIDRANGTLQGAADSRRDGCALGY